MPEPLKNALVKIIDYEGKEHIEILIDRARSAVDWLKDEIAERTPDYEELMKLINIAYDVKGKKMVCENCQKLANDVDLWKTKYKEIKKELNNLKGVE